MRAIFLLPNVTVRGGLPVDEDRRNTDDR